MLFKYSIPFYLNNLALIYPSNFEFSRVEVNKIGKGPVYKGQDKQLT